MKRGDKDMTQVTAKMKLEMPKQPFVTGTKPVLRRGSPESFRGWCQRVESNH
jgi:hypothetical protein